MRIWSFSFSLSDPSASRESFCGICCSCEQKSKRCDVSRPGKVLIISVANLCVCNSDMRLTSYLKLFYLCVANIVVTGIDNCEIVLLVFNAVAFEGTMLGQSGRRSPLSTMKGNFSEFCRFWIAISLGLFAVLNRMTFHVQTVRLWWCCYDTSSDSDTEKGKCAGLHHLARH